MSKANRAKPGFLVVAMAAAISAGICSTSAPMASATLLAYEPFNYTPGTSLVGTTTTGTGFTGTWSDTGSGGGTESFSVSSGSLTYSSLATADNSVTGITATSGTYPNDVETLATPIAGPTATDTSVTTWYSVLIRTPSSVSNPGGLDIVATGHTIFAGTSSSSAWGLSYVGGGNGSTGASTISADTTYLVVLENVATYVSGAESDTWSLYVDPTVGQTSPGVAATVVNTTLVAGKVTAIGMSSVKPYSWDEIRVGTTYASVTPAVPEPATLGLLLLAGGSLLLKKRRPSAQGPR
jgi:hypothetical protein